MRRFLSCVMYRCDRLDLGSMLTASPKLKRAAGPLAMVNILKWRWIVSHYLPAVIGRRNSGTGMGTEMPAGTVIPRSFWSYCPLPSSTKLLNS